MISAEEALSAGLISRLAPAERHVETAEALADECLKPPPLSVRANVRLRRLKISPLQDDFDAMMGSVPLHLSRDYHEAAAAFKEKREPLFTAS